MNSTGGSLYTRRQSGDLKPIARVAVGGAADSPARVSEIFSIMMGLRQPSSRRVTLPPFPWPGLDGLHRARGTRRPLLRPSRPHGACSVVRLDDVALRTSRPVPSARVPCQPACRPAPPSASRPVSSQSPRPFPACSASSRHRRCGLRTAGNCPSSSVVRRASAGPVSRTLA